jgi:hypothetical protein
MRSSSSAWTSVEWVSAVTMTLLDGAERPQRVRDLDRHVDRRQRMQGRRSNAAAARSASRAFRVSPVLALRERGKARRRALDELAGRVVRLASVTDWTTCAPLRLRRCVTQSAPRWSQGSKRDRPARRRDGGAAIRQRQHDGSGAESVRQLEDQSTQLARPADRTTASRTAGPARIDLSTPRRMR